MHHNKKDITGKKSGKLTALHCTDTKSTNGDFVWVFQCDCGNTCETTIGRFNSGHTSSCGCSVSEAYKKRSSYHGKSKTPEYKTWTKMRERCFLFSCKDYKDYGAVGITVCERWKDSFKNFYEDMGDKPSKDHTIDRIDSLGDYTPDNCRWATIYTQAMNKAGRKNVSSEYKGVYYDKVSSKWVAVINIGKGSPKKIGRYHDEEHAAIAYNTAVNMIYGENSDEVYLNELDGDDSVVNFRCKFFSETVFLLREEVAERPYK